jgi:hypothetical protein
MHLISAELTFLQHLIAAKAITDLVCCAVAVIAGVIADVGAQVF